MKRGDFVPSYKNILSKSYMLCGDRVKLVICTKNSGHDATLSTGCKIYKDSFNDDEPYDRKTHVFYFPLSEVTPESILCLSFRRMGLTFRHSFRFGLPEFADEKALLSEYDNSLAASETQSEEVTPGVRYTHTLYCDKSQMPVHVFVTEVDPRYAAIYVGTPDDSYRGVKVRATIPDMAEAAMKKGRKIVAAVNADFFDIFGDFHPAGLCVKNGRVIANRDSKRNFVAVLKDGRTVITSLGESPALLKDILHAASGLQMIVRDGEIFDYAALEPFSFTRHPRTAVGVRKDGSIVIMVVDGRIPDYSNGATLVDLAKLMISYGADRAINLDGGGSSAMYTVRHGEFILHSRPADLFRPTAKLIRKDYNSLLVELKK